ncbi:MAG: acyltransferase, partial [Lachnospiraceae bacterium]|nr:acyltransferase [Lachnospiraceae bacterium]
YGKILSITGRIAVHGPGNISIGNDVSIHSSPNVNPVAGGSRTHLRTEAAGKLLIGNHVGISHSAITAFESIIIDDNALIGSNCMICDTDFHSIGYEQRMEHPDTHVKTAAIHIGEGAFIGARCIILKGVSIGRHSVIGAGSVVTKNVPDNEIWGGNPAIFIRKAI